MTTMIYFSSQDPFSLLARIVRQKTNDKKSSRLFSTEDFLRISFFRFWLRLVEFNPSIEQTRKGNFRRRCSEYIEKAAELSKMKRMFLHCVVFIVFFYLSNSFQSFIVRLAFFNIFDHQLLTIH